MLSMRQLVLISIIFCNGIKAEPNKPVAPTKKFTYDLGFAKWKRNRVLLDRKGKLPKSAYKYSKDGKRRLKLSFATFLIDAHGKKIAVLGSATLAAGGLIFGLHKQEQKKQALAREKAKQERERAEAERAEAQKSKTSAGALVPTPQQQSDLNSAAVSQFLIAIDLDPNKNHSPEIIDQKYRARFKEMLPTRGSATFNEQLKRLITLRLAAINPIQRPSFTLRLEAPKHGPLPLATDPHVTQKADLTARI